MNLAVGGRGGDGGSGGLDVLTGASGGGGGGGAGGAGLMYSSGGYFYTNNITPGMGDSIAQGGDGGRGGDGYFGGSGGSGGAGIYFKGTSSDSSGLIVQFGHIVTGGAGGVGGGGDTSDKAGVGGSGGAGINASNAWIAIAGHALVKGGNGGASASAGGAGGAGIVASSSAINVTGTVMGGDGGSSKGSGKPGIGGDGITGSDLTINNSGRIVAGSGSGTSADGAAIRFTGGTNFLNMYSSESGPITGDIALAGGKATIVGWGPTKTVDTVSGWSGLTTQGSLDFTGTSTLTGSVTVNSGTLWVSGSIASASGVTVENGATLSGTGTVAPLEIKSGGTLAPGKSAIGTLNVSGNVTFDSGSNYYVKVSPSDADKTAATGSANLTGGAVTATYETGSYLSKTYTILTADGGRGGTQFASLKNVSLPTGFTASLAYPTANDVTLVLALAKSGPTLPPGTQGTSDVISQYFNNGGSLPPGFVTLQGSGPNAFTQVTGQPGAGQSQSGFSATTEFVTTVSDNLDSGGTAGGGSGATSYASERPLSPAVAGAYAAVTPRDRAVDFGERWSVWATGYGGTSSVSGNVTAGTVRTTSQIYGVVVGAGLRPDPDTRIGFALGGAGTSFGLDQGLGSGRSDMFNAAIYAKRNFGPAYISGVFGYSWQSASTDRTVTVSGTDMLHASFQPQALTARVEGGWRAATPVGDIIPYGAFQSVTFFMPSYAESATLGSNQFALSYAGQQITASRTELGARFENISSMPDGDGIWKWKGRVAWAHDWNTDRTATATFQALPGSSSFTVNGAEPAADAVLVSFGGEIARRSGWSVSALYDGEFSSTTAVHAGRAKIRYGW